MTRWVLRTLAVCAVVFLAASGSMQQWGWLPFSHPPMPEAHLTPPPEVNTHVQNRILTYTLYLEAPDQLVLDVTYTYSGDRGRHVFLQAITLTNGRSNGHWAYVPAKVYQGRHTARINIEMNQQAPARYHSDQIEFGFYTPQGPVFDRRVVPHAKTWVRRPR